MTHWSGVIRQKAHSAGARLPVMRVQVGWGVSEVLAAFVTTLARWCVRHRLLVQAVLKNPACGWLGLAHRFEAELVGVSQLFALVGDTQFELPALKAHQHAAKLVPADLPTINDEKRHAAIAGIVPLNPTAHDSMIGDL
jgi:hypothetical protein